MSFISTTITLFLIQDPIGNIPVFLSLLQATHPRRRLWIIIRENLIALWVLATFLFFGKSILNLFQLTEQGLGIAGGVILFFVAFQMIFSSSASTTFLDRPKQEPLIVPLAVPLLAGPSSIAMVTLLSTQYPNQLGLCLLSLMLVSFFSILILLSALSLYKLLGLELLQAFEKIMGIILMTLAIQMFLNNISFYIKNGLLFK